MTEDNGRPWRLVLAQSTDIRWLGLRQLLRTVPAQILGTPTLEAVADAGRHLRPDAIVVVTDGDQDKIADLVTLRIATPSVPLLIIADRPDGQLQMALAAFGRGGFLLWESVTISGLYWALGGMIEERYGMGSEPVVQAIATPPEDSAALLETLSDQDRQILPCLAAGLTEEQIAQAAGMGLRSVQRHIAELKERLGADNALALRSRAWQLGFRPPDGHWR